MADNDDDKDDKTEEATPRRRDEAREEGQVALSQDVIGAASLLVAVLALMFGGAQLAAATGALFDGSIALLPQWGAASIDEQMVSGWFWAASQVVALPAALVVLPLFVAGLLGGYGQVGFRLAPKAIAPDAKKINPASGLKRIFGMRAVMRTTTATLKIVAITAAVSITAWTSLPALSGLPDNDLGPVLAAAGWFVLRCVSAALIAAVAIAGLDWFWTRRQHDNELKMSKKDIKDEHKQTEGDPHIKAKIRAVQREMARRRMMADVPKATVVVTNPTHYAVALRWDEAEGARLGRTAPWVVAKGVDAVAQRIKAVASQHEVVLYEDVPLARALHRQVEIGDQVPEGYYEAVAAVLAYVYRVKGLAPAAAQGS